MAEVVFRSTHPDVLSVLADYKATVGEWHEQVAVLLADLGFEGRSLVVANGLGSRWNIGVEILPADEAAPAGWRVATRSGQDVLVPDKRRKAGRDAFGRIEANQPPADVRRSLPGMPAEHWVGNAIRTPALDDIDGAVWVRWQSDVPGVDLDIWERVRLSQYWAAREAQDAEAVTAS